MYLDRLLVRCRAFEARAAAVYRGFATRTRSDPEMCALWTALARQEEAHENALARATSWLEARERCRATLDGWEEELYEIEARLSDAERPDIGADVERQLVAAMALERTELDTLFSRLLAVLPPNERMESDAHTAPLLTMAARRSVNPAVAREAALLDARQHARHAS